MAKKPFTIDPYLTGITLAFRNPTSNLIADLVLPRTRVAKEEFGYNVYPAEIEGVINTLTGVMESAVVGVRDADFGEVGVAVVIAKPGATLEPANILQKLKTMLANFKVPKSCYVVTELPRNAMGKVQKNVLRAQYQP